MGSVAGILLAAGMSRRLGQPKQLLPYHGRSLVRHAAETGLASGLSPVVVVVGAFADDMARELADLPVQLVHNPHYAKGQSTSLRVGVAALPADIAAVVLLLVDMPAVGAPVIRQVVEAWQATGALIVRPAFDGQPGNPALFAAALLPELAAVQGDEGGRPVLRRHAAAVHLVPVSSAAVLRDVDTWEQYRALVDEPAAGENETSARGGRR